jgi:hypothetical protein
MDDGGKANALADGIKAAAMASSWAAVIIIIVKSKSLPKVL